MSDRSLLVIEDDDDLRGLLRELLVDAQFDVREARDGKAALEIYRQHRVDVVLTDIFMPRMDGFEVIQALRKINPSVKIVAMSGEDSSHVADAMLRCAGQLGAALVIRKPFSADELILALETVLR